MISPNRTKYVLRITCANAYPHLLVQCRLAIQRVRGGPKPPGYIRREGCVEVYSSWKHWPCLFPQHGPGRKHERTIRLVEWQQEIVDMHPRQLIRGLIHSDGYRGANVVKGQPYMRYQFTNRSDDIRGIFCDALDLLDIRWRRMNRNTISVARRRDVEALDRFVGPKR